MRTNTRLLFKMLLSRCRVDCVLDVGSCDGCESLMFRQILPKAKVIAFEANPFLYKKIAANPSFSASGIEVLPWAMTNKRGTACFHVTDLDYDDPVVANPGTSSLLVHKDLKIKETVEVETHRIDEFLLSRHPGACNVGLWIDVEGVEFDVLEGMAGVKDRVAVVHVETARAPMRAGQKVYGEVERLMKSLGFVPIGTNMSRQSTWGDVVFVNEKIRPGLGWHFHSCRLVAWLSEWLRLNLLVYFLKKHCSPLHRLIWRIYSKFFS